MADLQLSMETTKPAVNLIKGLQLALMELVFMRDNPALFGETTAKYVQDVLQRINVELEQ